MGKFNVGILGSGMIAGVMAKTVNGMKDVALYAVGSRSMEKAKAFADKFGCRKAYGTYEDLVSDKKIDLIYIATPHSEHYANARLCIQYKKPVLCEKAFTANAKQAEELIHFAEEKGVFIAEAIWTRYMPLLNTITDAIDNGVIGEPKMLTANLGYAIKDVPRLVRPELAGGALLDLGVYPLNFAAMIFGSDVEKITSACTFTKSGVDEQNSMTLTYADGRMAVLHSTMCSNTDRRGIIYGTEGYMEIANINNYEGIKIYDLSGKKVASCKRPKQITGYEYEVEACMKALKKNKLECPEMPHAETIRMMKMMDSIRAEWGIKFPFED